MNFIIKPLVTEKMTNITEKQNNKFGFVVRPEANKIQIKAGKAKSRYTKTGLVRGRTNAFKKAIVTLADGETIDFYSNI